jgi:hypothetical protein
MALGQVRMRVGTLGRTRNKRSWIMGRISEKLVAVFRGQAPAPELWVRKDLLKTATSLFNGAPLADQLLDEGYDPLHIRYILAHQMIMMFADTMRDFDEFDEYGRAVGLIVNRFAPHPDESTPVTFSFLSLWMLCDVRFGRDRETIGTCLLDLLQAVEADAVSLQLIRSLSESRMGVYQHQGSQGRYVIMRELVSGRELRVQSASGHRGERGELWFVRLGGPLDEDQDYFVTLNTPYILTDASVDDWTAFLNKSLVTAVEDEPRTLHELLKYGRRPESWHEFLVRGFVRSDQHAVYVAGLPDVPSSLPNAERIESFAVQVPGVDAAALQLKARLKLTLPQRQVLVDVVPELAPHVDLIAAKMKVVEAPRLLLQRWQDRIAEATLTWPRRRLKPAARVNELVELDRRRSLRQAVYRIRISLCFCKPVIWRTIEVPNCSLNVLHQLIQAAIGWSGDKRYLYRVGDEQYRPLAPRMQTQPPQRMYAARTDIDEVVPLGDDHFRMQYICGTDLEWEFSLTVEGIGDPANASPTPACIAGERAWPPADAGGPERYEDLLLSWAEPDNPYRQNLVDWLGADFDPERFSVAETTDRLRRVWD